MPEKSSNPFAKNLVNLASPLIGAKVVFATDEFFAAKERLIGDTEPIFIPEKYDDHGKWMDGWESRRRRDGGHDYCILSLKSNGIIHGFDINTLHFTGNHPPHASIDGTHSKKMPDKKTEWTEIVPKTAINANAHNFINVTHGNVVSHLRLNIYPDGGVARFRAYGRPVVQWDENNPDKIYELSAIAAGGYIVDYNDAHYGDPWVILTKGRGKNMGDGWETRRRREPGNDWIIIALGNQGILEKIEIDTAHFKGNYPDRCSVDALMLEPNSDLKHLKKDIVWNPLMKEKKLEMDRIHTFQKSDILLQKPVSHLRLNIYPDGGISRFRAFGKVDYN